MYLNKIVYEIDKSESSEIIFSEAVDMIYDAPDWIRYSIAGFEAKNQDAENTLSALLECCDRLDSLVREYEPFFLEIMGALEESVAQTTLKPKPMAKVEKALKVDKVRKKNF